MTASLGSMSCLIFLCELERTQALAKQSRRRRELELARRPADVCAQVLQLLPHELPKGCTKAGLRKTPVFHSCSILASWGGDSDTCSCRHDGSTRCRAEGATADE